jgi:hypothetical protein
MHGNSHSNEGAYLKCCQRDENDALTGMIQNSLINRLHPECDIVSFIIFMSY